MDLLNFLKQSKDTSFWKQTKVLCFRGDSYSLLFFRYFFDSLVKYHDDLEKPEYLVAEKLDPNRLFSSLQQSFLGQEKFYWLGDYSGRLDKKKEKIFDFLQGYSGPHTVSLFTPGIKNSKSDFFTIIDLPENLNKLSFLKLLVFFSKEYSEVKKTLISNVFQRVSTISLDEACRFLDCLDLVSAKTSSQFDRYINLFLEPEKSLFSLAGYFFARNTKAFFALWKDIYKDYPDVFWIMYWSDQVWRAYYVVKFQRQKKFQELRKISFRLPFTFSKVHWKNFSLNELANAHDFLYKADFSLKTGSTFCSLDLFLSKHFSKKFLDEK